MSFIFGPCPAITGAVCACCCPAKTPDIPANVVAAPAPVWPACVKADCSKGVAGATCMPGKSTGVAANLAA